MKKYLPLAWRLGLIVAVVVAMLSVVNHFTAPAIAEAEQAAGNAARAELIDGTFEQLPADRIPEEYRDTVTAIYEAKTDGSFAGYCMDVSTNGYGGEIKLVVAMDANLTVIGVKVISHAETSGIGSKAVDENGGLIPAFKGKTERNLNEVSAISGASISSKAVKSGVENAVAAGKVLKEGGAVNG